MSMVMLCVMGQGCKQLELAQHAHEQQTPALCAPDGLIMRQAVHLCSAVANAAQCHSLVMLIKQMVQQPAKHNCARHTQQLGMHAGCHCFPTQGMMARARVRTDFAAASPGRVLL